MGWPRSPSMLTTLPFLIETTCPQPTPQNGQTVVTSVAPVVLGGGTTPASARDGPPSPAPPAAPAVPRAARNFLLVVSMRRLPRPIVRCQEERHEWIGLEKAVGPRLGGRAKVLEACHRGLRRGRSPQAALAQACHQYQRLTGDPIGPSSYSASAPERPSRCGSPASLGRTWGTGSTDDAANHTTREALCLARTTHHRF